MLCFESEEQSRVASKSKILPIAAGSVTNYLQSVTHECVDEKHRVGSCGLEVQ